MSGLFCCVDIHVTVYLVVVLVVKCLVVSTYVLVYTCSHYIGVILWLTCMNFK